MSLLARTHDVHTHWIAVHSFCGSWTAMEGNRPRHEVRINCLRARRVSIRIEAATLILFDPDSRELLRTGPKPLT